MTTISIPLTQGKYATIDEEDSELASQFTWRAVKLHNTWYAHAWDTRTKPRKLISLHRLIMGFPNEQIDHKNLNGLDCTRDNLRLASHGQNKANGHRYANNQSGFKGVYSSRNTKNPWCAQIRFHNVVRHLGHFPTKEIAAEAYNQAAKELHGEFARDSVEADHTPTATEVPNTILAKSHLRSDNQTGYRGVSIQHQTKRYKVICKGEHIGYYDTPEQAAHAYDKAARELLGPKAVCNFPEDQT